MELLFKPWPWYVVGPIIGLTVPTLLLLGDKRFGISSTLRQICAACIPANISFLKYDWKADQWNLFFVAGVLLGGFLGGYVLANPNPVAVSDATVQMFSSWNLTDVNGLLPEELFNWNELITLRGFILMVIGGFLVGFGTRYAGGCTSGHGIFGLSALQWPSLLAIISFFIGGILISHFVLPYLLTL